MNFLVAITWLIGWVFVCVGTKRLLDDEPDGFIWFVKLVGINWGYSILYFAILCGVFSLWGPHVAGIR